MLLAMVFIAAKDKVNRTKSVPAMCGAEPDHVGFARDCGRILKLCCSKRLLNPEDFTILEDRDVEEMFRQLETWLVKFQREANSIRAICVVSWVKNL